MTLEQRKRIWAKREAKRKEMLKRKMIGTAGVIALLFVSVAATVFFSAGKAQAKEDKVYYKYSTVYEIQPGDTLTSIAKNHLEGYESINEYVDEVKFMNQLCSSDSLVAGNKIFIPYCSTEIK